MLRFLAGFLAASALWGITAYLYAEGNLASLGLAPQVAECPPASDAIASAPPTDERIKKKARKGKRAVAKPGDPNAGGDELATIGEDIGWDDERTVDMAGGEGQLTGQQIEAGFDGAMPRIRRCLVLVPSDGEVKGQLVFGMKVGSDGKPKAVNLTGPGLVTGGESGSCLRAAASAIRFATFQGPDMVFKYPITLQ